MINRINKIACALKRFDYALLDTLLIILGISTLSLFRADHVVIFFYLFLPIYLLFTKRASMLILFVLASLISVLWQVIASDFYGYNYENIMILGFNAFPLLAWAIGLVGIYMLNNHIATILGIKNLFWRIALFCVVYWLLMLTMEHIGYHEFNIKNIQTAGYPPLPICNCLHVPHWIQGWYLLCGPIFFVIVEFLIAPRVKLSK